MSVIDVRCVAPGSHIDANTNGQVEHQGDDAVANIYYTDTQCYCFELILHCPLWADHLSSVN
jgi:hypothetical protein